MNGNNLNRRWAGGVGIAVAAGLIGLARVSTAWSRNSSNDSLGRHRVKKHNARFAVRRSGRVL